MRRVPTKLQPFLGGKARIRRSLGVTTTNQADPVAIQAWNRVHTEVEALFAQAMAEQERALVASPPPIPLAPRNAAGIAAEPWRQLLNSLDSGRISAESRAMVEATAPQLLDALLKLLKTGDIHAAQQAREAIAQQMLEPTLKSL